MAQSSVYEAACEIADPLRRIDSELEAVREVLDVMAENMPSTFDRIAEALFLVWVRDRYSSVAAGAVMPKEVAEHFAAQARLAAEAYLRVAATHAQGAEKEGS